MTSGVLLKTYLHLASTPTGVGAAERVQVHPAVLKELGAADTQQTAL